ncbi:unnamed protein product [Caenorhabditis brenneri]
MRLVKKISVPPESIKYIDQKPETIISRPDSPESIAVMVPKVEEVIIETQNPTDLLLAKEDVKIEPIAQDLEEIPSPPPNLSPKIVPYTSDLDRHSVPFCPRIKKHKPVFPSPRKGPPPIYAPPPEHRGPPPPYDDRKRKKAPVKPSMEVERPAVAEKVAVGPLAAVQANGKLVVAHLVPAAATDSTPEMPKIEEPEPEIKTETPDVTESTQESNTAPIEVEEPILEPIIKMEMPEDMEQLNAAVFATMDDETERKKISSRIPLTIKVRPLLVMPRILDATNQSKPIVLILYEVSCHQGYRVQCRINHGRRMEEGDESSKTFKKADRRAERAEPVSS